MRAASDSKRRKTEVFKGFFVNCYGEMNCVLAEQSFLLEPHAGALVFISAFGNFRIPEDVTVVVVEGHENFREIQRQRYLFEGLRPLFVWRYQNSRVIAEWLNMIPNNYLHFGDFDFKGIHIYLSEFKRRVVAEKGAFLIPNNIEELLSCHGENALYENQKSVLSSIKTTDEQILNLIGLIRKYRKGLAQEILISRIYF